MNRNASSPPKQTPAEWYEPLHERFLLKALDELPENQRKALLLQVVSGFSIREIAEIQRVSEGAVKTRISRARSGLRDLLPEQIRADSDRDSWMQAEEAREYGLVDEVLR
jgi:RNA polymerase sigma factor (sigma-70 family)